MDYPDHLHDSHSDYPLAPERLIVETDMLSAKQHEQQEAYNTKARSTKFAKLVPNLFAKHNYACHYANLRFYLEHGLILKKIHRVLRFHQSRWLAPYIAKNSELRARARNDFEKEFYKLMNNAVYGKTCENVLKRQDIRLVTDSVKTKKLIDKPHCLGFKIFTENIAAIAMQKLAAEVNKPTYVGLAVLEYAKLHMYRFHYDQALKQWPDGHVRLILTDTDSLLYEIETEDVYENIRSNPELHGWFDLSNYAADHPLNNVTNKMVIGKMKDETAGKIMCEVVGLRAKMYSFKVYDPVTDTFKTTKKAKGIQKAAMETVTHDQYLEQLHNPEENHVTVRRIGQVMHTVLTFEQQKRGLCAFDDKRYLLDDCVDTLAHGHYKLRSEQHRENENNDGDSDTRPGPSQQGASVVTDEDGDEHLVVTQRVVVQSPVLQHLFETGDADEVDGESQRSASAASARPAAIQPQQLPATAPKRSREPAGATSKQAQAPKQPKLQQSVPVLVDEDELATAKNALRTRFNEMDVEIAETLVQAALVGLNGVASTTESLKAALQKRGGMDALCALAMLDDAQKSDKKKGLSNDEQLLFVVVKSTKVYHAPYTVNPHKSLFMLLTGRSANWWDNNHKRMLRSITEQPRT